MKIKYILFSFIFCLLTHFNSLGQSSPESLQKPIIQFFEGFSQLSEKLIRENTTEDFVLLEDGMLWNNDTLATKIKGAKSMNFERKNTFKFIHSEERGDTAWLTYWNQADITVGGKNRVIRWLESAVLVRQADRWKIRMLHSTPLKKAP
ncbi:nuclear transport factor 2 family protein [Aquirufa rosea]|uniref:Nuclear transport factor 2 family protein n=1 Tax=Aquirufa rosea TaxID=2509241 RepID=A0A4Q1BX17_9BACT|nr:nuclear transport factor 2 family protein [Aquirufa rosea]RXK46551.1 nuclear transport factor 2 family protein [Aquirufa rosea]